MKKGVEGNRSSASRWDERAGIPISCSVGHCQSCWIPSREANKDIEGLEHGQRQEQSYGRAGVHGEGSEELLRELGRGSACRK